LKLSNDHLSKQIQLLLELRTGCRLHFGLMELAAGSPGRFAGLGVMLSEPSMVLRTSAPTNDVMSAFSLSDADQAAEPSSDVNSESISDADRTANLTADDEYRRRIATWAASTQLDCSIEILQAYPFHCGLGTGTQLASLLTVASWLSKSGSRLSGDWQSVDQLVDDFRYDTLAEMSGRGLRSGIGLFGFLHGGLVWDRGYLPGAVTRTQESLSRVSMPDTWRFVLLRPGDSSGISGLRENSLIDGLRGQTSRDRDRMCKLAEQICNAALEENFESFCCPLEQYLRLAASLFAPAQGGLYNGTQATLAAQCAQDLGLRAVGQSSWGPTVFGLADSPDQAQGIAQRISSQFPEWDIWVSEVANTGAQVRLARVGK
jgi:beta-RFAP synthase